MPDPEDLIGRRAFLTGGFLRHLLKPVVDRATAPLDRMQEAIARAQAAAPAAWQAPILRPPGAVAEADFLAGCTRCGDCHAACPYQAIRNAGPRFGQAAGTPMVDPGEQPCLACPDTPCITACLPGVLRRDDGPFPALGTARITANDCLAHQGTACTACGTACPVPGSIILDNDRPVVVPTVCVGCGACQKACPAPRNAVVISPLSERPAGPLRRDS